MKVKALVEFFDIKAKTVRDKGEVFECSKARYEEIKKVGPEWVQACPVKKKAE